MGRPGTTNGGSTRARTGGPPAGPSTGRTDPPVLGTDDRPDHRPDRRTRNRDAEDEAEDEAEGSASPAPDGVALDYALIRAAETAEPSARARMLTERRRHEEPEPQPWQIGRAHV